MRSLVATVLAVFLASSARAGTAPPLESVSELDQKELLAALRLSVGYMRTKERAARAAVVRELRARQSVFPAQALALLAGAHARQVKTLKAYLTQAGAFADSRRARIRHARRRALAAVFDELAYDARSPGKSAQAKVDERVGVLSDLYYDPLPDFFRAYPEAEETRRNVSELEEILKSLRAMDAKQVLDPAAFRGDFLERYTDALRTELNRKIMRENEALGEALGAGLWSVARAINEYRDMMGLDRLVVDLRLVMAAQAHSREMRDLNYFGLLSPLVANRTVVERTKRERFDFSALAQNIFRGGRKATDAYLGWYNAADHHRNMLNARFTHLGLGAAKAHTGQQLWTLVLGRPRNDAELPTLESENTGNREHPLAVYHRRARALAPADHQGHWRLADWCGRHGLLTQQALEAVQVLKAAPDHEDARKVLGYERAGDVWVRPGAPGRAPPDNAVITDH